MKLFLLIALTMVAFAANSVLNRVAVDSGSIDAGAFATVRVLSGAAMLGLLVLVQRRKMVFASSLRLVGAASLTIYMVGFSLAYRALDAGLGALLIFGAVQIAIYGISAVQGQPATRRQLTGSVVAFAGLVWILWPGGAQAVDARAAMFMLLAGVGWAVYTLAGRREGDPLAGTAANFLVALPLTAAAVWLSGQSVSVTSAGIGWAVLSGAITSGLGYALWYAIVPLISPATAALAMLSVPVIALFSGVLLLGEDVSLRLIGGAAIVLGGISFAVSKS